jgi:hypothetical protein
MSDLVSDLFCRVPADFLQNKQPVIFGGAFLKALTTDYLALTDQAVRELVNKTCDEFDVNTSNLATARATLGHEDGGVVDTLRVLGLKLLSSKISNWQIARLELASCSPNVSKSDVAKRVSLTIATLARDVVSEVSGLKAIAPLVLFAVRLIFYGGKHFLLVFQVLYAQAVLQNLVAFDLPESSEDVRLVQPPSFLNQSLGLQLKPPLKGVFRYYAFDKKIAGFVAAVEHLVDVSAYWSVKYGTGKYEQHPHYEFGGFVNADADKLRKSVPVRRWVQLNMRSMVSKVYF